MWNRKAWASRALIFSALPWVLACGSDPATGHENAGAGGIASGGQQSSPSGGTQGAGAGNGTGTGGSSGATTASGGAGAASSGGGSGSLPIASNDLLDFERLPNLRMNVHANGTSSASMLDDNTDANHYLDGEGFTVFGGEFVMMQATGPGVLERLWHTDSGGLGGVYHVYVDGNDSADLSLSLQDWFGGAHEPLSAPLMWNREQSSGGYVSYVPIFFEKSLMLTVSEASGTEYFNVGYSTFDPGTEVTSFTGAEDLSALRSAWANAGDNPIPAGDLDETTSATVDVPAGNSVEVATFSGPAEIVELRVHVPGLGSSVTAQDLNSVHLQILWDGDDAPAVDAPLADFFGSGILYGADVKALPVGNSGGDFYCYFPMPFQTSADIRLLGTSAAVSGVSVDVSRRPYDGDFASLGYFHASSFAASDDANQYPLLDVQGSGHWVGINIRFPGKGQVLEGNESVYVDGLRFPSIHGTGTEDFFNAGWYFEHNTFSLPTHGASLDASGNGPLNAYRFFLDDAVPFSSSLFAQIQHQPGAAQSSVAYFYLNSKVRSAESDSIDFADAGSVSSHEYTATGSTPLHVTDRFLMDPTDYTFDGFSVASGSEITFKVALDASNDGIALRRVLLAAGVQAAEVSVDGDVVGVWQTLESAQDAAAKDPAAAHLYEREYWIPSTFTQGKDSVAIKLTVQSDTWNDLGYSIRNRTN